MTRVLLCELRFRPTDNVDLVSGESSSGGEPQEAMLRNSHIKYVCKPFVKLVQRESTRKSTIFGGAIPNTHTPKRETPPKDRWENLLTHVDN